MTDGEIHRSYSLGIVALLLLGADRNVAGQEPGAKPAVPRDAIAAIVDAYREYGLVGLGDAHGKSWAKRSSSR